MKPRQMGSSSCPQFFVNYERLWQPQYLRLISPLNYYKKILIPLLLVQYLLPLSERVNQ